MAGAPPARAARPPPMRRRTLLPTLGILAASTGLMWLIAVLSVLVFARGARDPRTQELVIPAGTSRDVATGGNPLVIPPSLSFVAGDVLVLRNEDDMTHVVGPYTLPPGGSARMALSPSGSGSFLCTIHPSGRLLLDVQPRGLDLRLTVVPTLLLGPALGTVVALIWRVMRALGPDRPQALPPTVPQ